jgi:uncharacterized protein (TIGR02996 family)
MREAFEDAIRANPDDLAAWCAYADYLAEQHDPRGEFMQVQLALEDRARSPAEQEALRRRESELLAAHERDWLGELAPLVLDADPIYRDIRRMAHGFARGWLAELCCRCLTVAEARALVRAPQARLLGRLAVEDPEVEAPVGQTQQYIDSYYEPGPDVPDDVEPYDRPALLALAAGDNLAAVRVFRLGDGPTGIADDMDRHRPCHTVGEFAHEVVARLPILEELYLYAHSVQADDLFALPLPCLRILRFEHATEYPLDVLADNHTLGNLTHRLCHPHAQVPGDPDAYIRLDQLRVVCRSPHLKSLVHLQLRLTDFGDRGAEEIVSSGILKRLRILDLSYGCITDQGAAVLAACADLKNLEHLDLTMNAMTENGIAALEATGVRVTADQHHDEVPEPGEEDVCAPSPVALDTAARREV